MKSPNYIALAASFAIAVASLAVFSSTSTTAAPLAVINGTKVTNMAPVVVYADTGATVAAL
ncbi:MULTISPECIES: hypothetical protein [Rhodanobacteraceae]|uniref:hypothetical protein n=1 Tax=Rhodanobacteraceae TaxID=1775411 RepID=UPI000887294D|nr:MULTISPECIES: hypothetical protein [Rhodanobacteraceae]SDF32105.1 hypothetical protein SAMN04515659_0671 [Dyella sp. 333MFSha]SKB47461.1 hypothetical protein SAMN05660880_01197 [Luteibacter sp. 22Crub2.1]